jgi:hypothetical protein
MNLNLNEMIIKLVNKGETLYCNSGYLKCINGVIYFTVKPFEDPNSYKKPADRYLFNEDYDWQLYTPPEKTSCEELFDYLSLYKPFINGTETFTKHQFLLDAARDEYNKLIKLENKMKYNGKEK